MDQNLFTKSVVSSLVILFILSGYFINLADINVHLKPITKLYHACVKLFIVTIMIVLFTTACEKKKDFAMKSIISDLSGKDFYKETFSKFSMFYRFNVGLMLIDTVFNILLNYVKNNQVVKTFRTIIFTLYVTAFVIHSIMTSLNLFSGMMFVLYIILVGTIVYEIIKQKSTARSQQLCSYLISVINVNMLVPTLFCRTLESASFMKKSL